MTISSNYCYYNNRVLTSKSHNSVIAVVLKLGYIGSQNFISHKLLIQSGSLIMNPLNMNIRLL